MALKQFWTSIRSATRFLVPAVIADAPKFDGAYIELRLPGARDWLVPESVDGFDEDDFCFLPDNLRPHLAQCVNECRAIALQVASDEQATDEQLEAALTSLLGVLEVMRPDRFADLDALVIGKQVERELTRRLLGWVSRQSTYRANSWIIKADRGRCESRRFCRLIDLLVRRSERMVPRNNDSIWISHAVSR